MGDVSQVRVHIQMVGIAMMLLYAENDGAICGNGVVEDMEDCDCGRNPDGTLAEDDCCNCNNCTIPMNIVCSPSQGPCCDTNCQYLTNLTVCQVATECSAESRCSYPL